MLLRHELRYRVDAVGEREIHGHVHVAGRDRGPRGGEGREHQLDLVVELFFENDLGKPDVHVVAGPVVLGDLDETLGRMRRPAHESEKGDKRERQPSSRAVLVHGTSFVSNESSHALFTTGSIFSAKICVCSIISANVSVAVCIRMT